MTGAEFFPIAALIEKAKTVIVVAGNVKAVADTIQQLHALLNDVVSNTLKLTGEIDLSLAKRMTQDLAISKQPTLELSCIYTSLQRAVETFDVTAKREIDRVFTNKGIVRSCREGTICCLIGITGIYAFQRNEILLKQYAHNLRDRLLQLCKNDPSSSYDEQEKGLIDLFQEWGLETWEPNAYWANLPKETERDDSWITNDWAEQQACKFGY